MAKTNKLLAYEDVKDPRGWPWQYEMPPDRYVGEISALGTSPRRAIAALCQSRRWGKPRGFEPMDGGDPRFAWGFRFVAGGSSFKAAGQKLPGGYLLTWWK